MDSNNTPLKIVVADSSAILRSGVAAVLKRLPGLNIQPVEIATPESLRHYLQLHRPQAVIVSPTLGGWLDLPALKAEGRNGEARYVVPRGLTPDALYREVNMDQVFAANALMDMGLPLPVSSALYMSRSFRFVRVDA